MTKYHLWNRKSSLFPLNSKGQSLVETAITLPIFLMLFFFAFQFGGAVYQIHAIYQAANKGARAAVTSSQSDPTADVKAAVNKALAGSGMFKFKYTIEEPIVASKDSSEPMKVTIISEPQILVLKNFGKIDPDKSSDDPNNIFKFRISATAFPNHRGLPKTTAAKAPPPRAPGG